MVHVTRTLCTLWQTKRRLGLLPQVVIVSVCKGRGIKCRIADYHVPPGTLLDS